MPYNSLWKVAYHGNSNFSAMPFLLGYTANNEMDTPSSKAALYCLSKNEDDGGTYIRLEVGEYCKNDSAMHFFLFSSFILSPFLSSPLSLSIDAALLSVTADLQWKQCVDGRVEEKERMK